MANIAVTSGDCYLQFGPDSPTLAKLALGPLTSMCAREPNTCLAALAGPSPMDCSTIAQVTREQRIPKNCMVRVRKQITLCGTGFLAFVLDEDQANNHIIICSPAHLD